MKDIEFDYDAFEKELTRRGWVGISEMGSMGKCHLNDLHYLLVTDGLIIYSSIPFHNNVEYFPNETAEWWDGCDGPFTRNLFTWEKLDAVIKSVDERRAMENHK